MCRKTGKYRIGRPERMQAQSPVRKQARSPERKPAQSPEMKRQQVRKGYRHYI